MGGAGFSDLAHKAGVLEHIQGFLVTFPILCAHYHEIRARAARYAKRRMVANHLFYKAFQAISEFVYSRAIHLWASHGVR